MLLFPNRLIGIVLVLACLLLPACTSSKLIGERRGPTTPAAVVVESWSYGKAPGYLLRTPHYNVHTTIVDLEFATRLTQLLEAGIEQYQRFTPGLAISDRPMDCYLFATRAQWVDFTQRNTGSTARIFLQINRGGYTVRDWFVAYDIGRVRTFSVVAHEGFHQFASRNFIGRLPPFLEEGLACMFEDIDFNGKLPRFNLSVNRNRAHALRRAIEKRSLLPLERLVAMHAGEVVSGTGATIDTFYAQNWAFAKFLWEGENGEHRAGLQKLMTDVAKGHVDDPTRSHRRAAASWNPTAVPFILERYLGMPFSELSRRYDEYLRRIAYDELEAQFAS